MDTEHEHWGNWGDPEGSVSICQHPTEWLDWDDERPLFCGRCDADLQTFQPVQFAGEALSDD